MAMVVRRAFIAGRRAAAGGPRFPALSRRCYKTPGTTPLKEEVPKLKIPGTTPLEEVLKFFNPQADLAKASQLAEELTKVGKNESPEVAIPKAQGLLVQLSKIFNVSNLERRVSRLESSMKNQRKVGLGIASLFAAYLMGIPSSVYMAKLYNDNEISKLQERVVTLESARASTSIPLKVDARVCHEVKVHSEPNKAKNL